MKIQFVDGQVVATSETYDEGAALVALSNKEAPKAAAPVQAMVPVQGRIKRRVQNPTKYDEEIVRRARVMREQGMTYKAIASALGISSHSTVSYLLERAGYYKPYISGRGRGKRVSKYTLEQARMVQDMRFVDKLSMYAIHKRTGIPLGSINGLLKRRHSLIVSNEPHRVPVKHEGVELVPRSIDLRGQDEAHL